MNTRNNFNLTKIGVFYDGNYFFHGSNYYNYVHERKNRISIQGLHDFIRHKVAEEEGDATSYRHCQIVDAHYFRGRLNAKEASLKGNQLYNDRVFDDILMAEGVTTHYLPLRSFSGRKEEKGIDVLLALEAFEMALYKKFDVLVLITSDGDYVPLVRKLNTLGTRVMVLSWDFEYTDDYGNKRLTRTSQDLLEEVTYPVAMHEIIDNRVSKDSFLVANLFVPKIEKPEFKESEHLTPFEEEDIPEELQTSTVFSMKEGYGFITFPPTNLFFHYSEVQNVEFNDLYPGDHVQFRIAKNSETGQVTAVEVALIEDQ